MTHFILVAKTVDFHKTTKLKNDLLVDNPTSVVHTIEVADEATDDEFKELTRLVTRQIKDSAKAATVVTITEFE